MANPEFSPFEFQKEAILKSQFDAVARIIYLIGKGEPMKIDDITKILAKAEKEADIICGFAMINNSADTKEEIVREIIKRGYATLENNALKLTESGKELSQISLPLPIEKKLLL